VFEKKAFVLIDWLTTLMTSRMTSSLAGS